MMPTVSYEVHALRELGLTDAYIAKMMQTPERNISQWASIARGQANDAKAERLRMLLRLARAVNGLRPNYVYLFFSHPHPALGGQTPLEVLSNPANQISHDFHVLAETFVRMVKQHGLPAYPDWLQKPRIHKKSSSVLPPALVALISLEKAGLSMADISQIIGEQDALLMERLRAGHKVFITETVLMRMNLAVQAVDALSYAASSRNALFSRDPGNGLFRRSIADLIAAASRSDVKGTQIRIMSAARLLQKKRAA